MHGVENNSDLYEVLDDFFDAYDLDGARTDLRLWLGAAISKKYIWERGAPANLLYFYERLLLLIGAAYKLNSGNIISSISDAEAGKEDKSVRPACPGRKTIHPRIFPCLLSWEEWDRPVTVLKAFFEFLGQAGWEEYLHQLLHGGLSNISLVAVTEPGMLLPASTYLEKLLEATYLVAHNQRQQFADTDENGGTDEKGGKRFSKRPLLGDRAAEEPYRCISEAFQTFGLDDIYRVLEEWPSIAMRNKLSAYDEAADRGDLIDFCRELQRLVEALHVINLEDKTPGSGRWEEGLPEELRAAVLGFDQPVLLTSAEMDNPLMVLGAFFETFTMDYIRVELWDLLDAVISCEQDGERHLPGHNLLLTHDCILSLVVAGCSIHSM